MIFLRMWRLGDFAMFLADQGRDAVIIRRIATLEHFPLIGPPSSIGQVYLGPFFYYLMSPFLYLSAFNPVGLAFGVSLLSILGLIAGYFIIKSIVKEKVALIFLILSTFSYGLISSARFSWNPNLLPVFAFFTLFFLYKSLQTKKWLFSILYGMFFAFSFQLHHLAAFLAVPIAAGYLYQLWCDKKKGELFIAILIAMGGFLIVSSPLIIFDLKHGFLNTKNLYSLFTQQNVVAGGSPLTRLLETNHAFWQIIFQIRYPELISSLLSIVLIIITVVLLKRNKFRLFLFIHFVNLFSFIYFFSLLSSPRHPHYYGTIYLSLFIVLAYIAVIVSKKKYIIPASLGLLGIYLFFNAKQYYFITGSSSNQIQHAENVALSMVPHIDHKPFNISTYPIEFTSEETFTYFLEVKGLPVANREAKEVTDQMYVLCDREPCKILNSQSWNIDMFGKAKIDTMWEREGVKIYRLVHAQ